MVNQIYGRSGLEDACSGQSFVFPLNSYVKTTNIMVLGNGIFGRKLRFNEVMRVKPYEWN